MLRNVKSATTSSMFQWDVFRCQSVIDSVKIDIKPRKAANLLECLVFKIKALFNFFI